MNLGSTVNCGVEPLHLGHVRSVYCDHSTAHRQRETAMSNLSWKTLRRLGGMRCDLDHNPRPVAARIVIQLTIPRQRAAAIRTGAV